jgi:molybdate transport system substrate-binding protein
MRRGALAALLAVFGLLAACGRAPPSTDIAHLYAGSSLTDVLDALGADFEREHGARVVASYGASSTLAQQIREGAPPGVFLSASTEWADRVAEWGLVEPGTRVDLLTNALVVVVPRGATARPARLEDLRDARWTRVALADPTAVPAGKYAVAALAAAGVHDTVRERIVAAADVRTALAYVARGEAPVGIVYATDARSEAAVEVAFTVPSELHPRVVYPLLIVRGAGARDRALHDFLRTDAARAAFERAGFGVLTR